MNWNEIVDRVTPYVVRIETPEGHGTGFACFFNDNRIFWGVATAHHVVGHADRWQQPIRILHSPTKKVAFLKEEERVILSDEATDSAVILVPFEKFQFPEPLVPLLPTETKLPIGAEVGWLGFPAIGANTLCFFSGNISALQESRHAYLIDGVAISSFFSGGPVVYSTPTDGVQIVGAMSAYIANRNTGEALPGLSVAQDVSHFHTTIATMKSLDEARKKNVAKSPSPTPAQETPAPESIPTA